jgi:hypothetical protein
MTNNLTLHGNAQIEFVRREVPGKAGRLPERTRGE